MYKLEVDDKLAWLQSRGRVWYDSNIPGDRIRCYISTHKRFIFGSFQDNNEAAMDSLIHVIHYLLYRECNKL